MHAGDQTKLWCHKSTFVLNVLVNCLLWQCSIILLWCWWDVKHKITKYYSAAIIHQISRERPLFQWNICLDSNAMFLIRSMMMTHTPNCTARDPISRDPMNLFLHLSALVSLKTFISRGRSLAKSNLNKFVSRSGNSTGQKIHTRALCLPTKLTWTFCIGLMKVRHFQRFEIICEFSLEFSLLC